MTYTYGVVDKKRRYEVPFDYPEHLTASDVNMYADLYNVDIQAQTSWCQWPGEFIAEGQYDDLAAFFSALAPLGHKFPEAEFIATVVSYN